MRSCFLYCLNTYLTMEIALSLLDFCSFHPFSTNTANWDFNPFHCSPLLQLWLFLKHHLLFGFPCMLALMLLQQRIFQRGQIVPEVASGTVTTTGQLCQLTGSPPGTHARTHTEHWDRFRNRKYTAHTKSSGWHIQPCDLLKCLSLFIKHHKTAHRLICWSYKLLSNSTSC